MRRRSKSVADLRLRYLMIEGLLERKPRISYKARLRHLNLLLPLWLSRSFQPLRCAYAAHISVVIVELSGIKSINALIVLVIEFLYIIIMSG
jgi:hypothetical protein